MPAQTDVTDPVPGVHESEEFWRLRRTTLGTLHRVRLLSRTSVHSCFESPQLSKDLNMQIMTKEFLTGWIKTINDLFYIYFTNKYLLYCHKETLTYCSFVFILLHFLGLQPNLGPSGVVEDGFVVDIGWRIVTSIWLHFHNFNKTRSVNPTTCQRKPATTSNFGNNR